MSKTVERALAEFVRRAKAQTILELTGSGGWQGDLALMRERATTYEGGRSRKSARGTR